MALRTDFSDRACSIARAGGLLADPWILLVLRELLQRNDRFDAIVASTGGAESVISRRLATLVEHGLVVTEPYEDGRRARHVYRLTAAGRDTLPVLHALSNWEHRHGADPRFVQVFCTRCGDESPSADWCPTCDLPLDATATAWIKPSTPDVRTPLVG